MYCKRIFIVLAVSFFIGVESFAQVPVNSFITRADRFLKAYVSGGNVNYQLIKENISDVKSLYTNIANVDASLLDSAEAKAFYLNAYNILVIYEITKHYPINSPMDLGGFFDDTKHKVAGEFITLNQLEREKILKPYGDARIHFALVCAAKGCPPLANYAFQPTKLDEQLESRTKFSLNNNYFIRVNDAQKKVEISKIFEWYAKDFFVNHKTAISYINNFRNKKIPSDYSVSYYEYDWKLNKK